MLFSGGKFPEVLVSRADGRSDLFSSQTLAELKFCRLQTLFFGQKCEEKSVGQAGGWTGGRTLLHVQLWCLFSLFKLSKTVKVSTLLLHYCAVTLLCGAFISLYLVE